MSTIRNASPQNIQLGINDKSQVEIMPSADPIPQHLPLFFIWAQKGPTEKVVSASDKLLRLFGEETFKSDSVYYNHQTKFLKLAMSNNNVCRVKRFVPPDVGCRSNAILYIDIIEDDVPNYVRDSFGNYVKDPLTNTYKVYDSKPTIPGHRIRFVRETVDEDKEIGNIKPKQGTITIQKTIPADPDDEDSVEQIETKHSIMYPIFELRAKYPGQFYNNLGFAIGSLIGNDVDKKIVTETKALPYKIALYTRENANSSPMVYNNLYREPTTTFTFKYKGINPSTTGRIDLEYVLENSFFNETNPVLAYKPSDYESIYFYRENFENISKRVLEKEIPYIKEEDQEWDNGEYASATTWFDFTTDNTNIEKLREEFLLINLFTGKSSKEIPYFSLLKAEDTLVATKQMSEFQFSVDTPIFLSGGSDGTFSNEQFEQYIVKEFAEYADEDSEVMDTATNKETIFYDSGFSLSTKLHLTNFIMLRKNTFLALSTHDAAMGNKCLSIIDERAIAIALQSKLDVLTESTYYNTKIARAIIMGGEGFSRADNDGNYVPLTYELLDKACKFMGSGDYKWRASEMFDRYPGNIVKTLVNYSPKHIPAQLKPALWSEGLVWAQPMDMSTFQIPAFQTVYPYDTSVLNSFFCAMACCTLSSLSDEVWRAFTGTVGLSDEAFIQEVKAVASGKVADLFAGMFTVQVDAFIDAADKARGYSWQLFYKIYAPNMKTVQTYTTETYRLDEAQ